MFVSRRNAKALGITSIQFEGPLFHIWSSKATEDMKKAKVDEYFVLKWIDENFHRNPKLCWNILRDAECTFRKSSKYGWIGITEEFEFWVENGNFMFCPNALYRD